MLTLPYLEPQVVRDITAQKTRTPVARHSKLSCSKVNVGVLTTKGKRYLTSTVQGVHYDALI